MRRAILVVAAVLAVGASCSSGKSASKEDLGTGPEKELVTLAREGDAANVKVVYTYSISGPLAGSVKTTITVVQRPPDVLRKIETTTRTPADKEVTVGRWSIRKGKDFYNCTTYGQEVSCIPSTEPPVTYGYQQLDEAAELVRSAGGFTTVRKTGTQMIAGEKATCFDARPRPATPPPVTSPQPRFTPTKFRFELCYASDGVLLKLKRSVAEPVPSGSTGTESTLEATSVTRKVSRSELELPGPVRSPQELVTATPKK